MKPGTLVAVWRDNGDVLITKTRSEVSIMGGRKVVWVEGISGAYALDAVRPILRRNINPFCLIAFEEAMAEAL
jgi:hypothetical protein